MKDKREALMEQIEDEIFCKDPTWTSGDIADLILLRERSMREEIKFLKEIFDINLAKIRSVEQENAELRQKLEAKDA